MEKELENSGKVAEAHCRLARLFMVPVRFGLRGGYKYTRNYQVPARFRELAENLGGSPHGAGTVSVWRMFRIEKLLKYSAKVSGSL